MSHKLANGTDTVTAAAHLRSDFISATRSGNAVNLLLSHHNLETKVKNSHSLENALHLRIQLRHREDEVGQRCDLIVGTVQPEITPVR